MNNWTIKKRITLGYALLLALVAVLTATAFFSFQRTKREAISLNDDSIPGFSAMARIDSKVGDIQCLVLRVLLAKTPEEKRKMQDEIASLRADILKTCDDYEKTISLAEDREMFNRLKDARDKYVALRTDLFALVNAGKAEEAMAFNQKSLEPAFEAYKKITDDLLVFNTTNADKAGDTTVAVAERAQIITSGLSLVVMVVGVLSSMLIVGGLNRALGQLSSSLSDSANQVSSAAGQVSASSQSLAEGSSEQAASLEETSSSLEEMSSMTQRNAANAQQANELAKIARAAADKGTADMQAMTGAMDAIKHSSDDIAKILKTIDEIAFQTNLLALNAAVEAARAGEAGAGFAVVADEVRSLAQRAAAAAKETAVKIETAISKSAQGVEISGKVATALSEIVTQVRKVDELVAEVAGASREQSQGITQINTAVSQMDKVTQSNAANAEESAAASEELNAQAESMKDAVRELMRLVQGNRASVPKEIRVKTGRLANGMPATVPAAKGRNGSNGHSVAAKTGLAAPARQAAASAIPMDGDFKEF